MNYYSNKNVPHSKEDLEVIKIIAEKKYREFMEVLGFDLSDPNAIDTPRRVVKSLVDEIWSGRYDEPPKVTSFPNTEKYDEIIFVNSSQYSTCAHHHLIFESDVYIGVLSNPDPNSKLIGLSKYHRIAEWICRRPTIQEDMTKQLHEEIDKVCKGNRGVAIQVRGKHYCACARGVKQKDSVMITNLFSGLFKDDLNVKQEFLSMISSVRKG